MGKISGCITDFVCANTGVDDAETKAVYKYGIEITLSSAINFVIIILCGLLLGDLIGGMIFMACFISLRSYTGGYHAEKYWRCSAAFVYDFILTYFAGRSFDYIGMGDGTFAVILSAAAVPVLRYAPVKNSAKVLSENKRRKSRIISMVLYTAFSASAIFLRLLNIRYGYLVLSTILSVSVLILVEVIMRKTGHHRSEGEL